MTDVMGGQAQIVMPSLIQVVPHIKSGRLKALGMIDKVIPEPIGGAHRDPAAAIASTGEVVRNALAELFG